MKRWDDYEDSLLTDLVFDSNLSAREMARDLEATEIEVKKRIRELGLSWVRRRDGHVSRGQAALTAVMRKLLPGATIRTEESIGERLKLDVYCPTFNLAAEYHGRQHFYFVEYFHGDRDGFYESKRRDERKLEICQDLGIALVVFRYNDALDEDSVYSRLLEGIRTAPEAEEESKKTLKGTPYYEAAKQRRREYQRDSYRRMKQRGRGL